MDWSSPAGKWRVAFVGCFIIGAIEPGAVALGMMGQQTQLIYGFVIVLSTGMHTILRRRIR